MQQVRLINGDVFSDRRGILKFNNGFVFSEVKRFYQITHTDETIVRAWQGHQVEHKYFYVVKGKFIVAWVKIDDWDMPSVDLKAESVTLSEEVPVILSIPPGYANGLQALEPDSSVIVYSNLNLQDSATDRWSFDQSFWLDWHNI